MNKKSKERHRIYLTRLLQHMSDGRERTSKECHQFIDSPYAKDVAAIMNRMKIELVETRSQFRLKKRIQGRVAYWRLEKAPERMAG